MPDAELESDKYLITIDELCFAVATEFRVAPESVENEIQQVPKRVNSMTVQRQGISSSSVARKVWLNQIIMLFAGCPLTWKTWKVREIEIDIYKSGKMPPNSQSRGFFLHEIHF